MSPVSSGSHQIISDCSSSGKGIVFFFVLFFWRARHENKYKCPRQNQNCIFSRYSNCFFSSASQMILQHFYFYFFFIKLYCCHIFSIEHIRRRKLLVGSSVFGFGKKICTATLCTQSCRGSTKRSASYLPESNSGSLAKKKTWDAPQSSKFCFLIIP